MTDKLAPVRGKCLCGKVEVAAEIEKANMGACHCSMCRKWTGGPFLAVECKSAVSLSGDEHISVYNSSEWAERAFCKNCGTHLFYRLKDGTLHAISAGLLDANDKLVFDHQVFIDEKPSNYSFANKTHDMTGAELFAAFAAGQE